MHAKLNNYPFDSKAFKDASDKVLKQGEQNRLDGERFLELMAKEFRKLNEVSEMSEGRNLSMGAMVPPGLEWQIGKTAGEIASINTLISLMDHLNSLTDTKSKKLALDTKELLVWLDVIKG